MAVVTRGTGETRMSAGQTAVVSTAVSAIVTVIVGTLVQWGARVAALVRRRVVPDHLPLTIGSSSVSTVGSPTDQVRMLVCCAPNRSLRRKEINPDQAVQFVRAAFGRWVGDEPVYSSPRLGVSFESPSGADHGFVWVNASGRVDVCRALPTTSMEPDKATFSVLSLLDVLADVADAMKLPEYDATFGHRLLRLPRRFDWAIAVSPTISAADWGAVSWHDVLFPGDVPPSRAGTRHVAVAPAEGYARTALRNWRLRRPRADLYGEFLRDFLYLNGYHNVDQPIRAAIAAAGPRPSPSPDTASVT